ncbi:riboflavin kinase [Xylariaceae sp. FL0016]|nr:riboflavin kinase [Xylariaceae sp. FL0016]
MADRPRILYTDAGPEPPFPLHLDGPIIGGHSRGGSQLNTPTANIDIRGDKAPSWIDSVTLGVYFGWASIALPVSHPDNPANPDAAAATAVVPPVTTTCTSEGIVDGDGAAGTTANGSDAPRRTSDGITLSTSIEVRTQAAARPSSKPADGTSSPPASAGKYHIFPMVMSIGYNPQFANPYPTAEVHVLSDFDADFYESHMRVVIQGFIREEKKYESLDALKADIEIDKDVARQCLKREAWTPREGVFEMWKPDSTKAGSENNRKITTQRCGKFDGSWLVRSS